MVAQTWACFHNRELEWFEVVWSKITGLTDGLGVKVMGEDQVSIGF